jgi:hypothetical protein
MSAPHQPNSRPPSFFSSLLKLNSTGKKPAAISTEGQGEFVKDESGSMLRYDDQHATGSRGPIEPVMEEQITIIADEVEITATSTVPTSPLDTSVPQSRTAFPTETHTSRQEKLLAKTKQAQRQYDHMTARLPLFSELSHLLDELEKRLVEIDKREQYVSRELMQLDHERRQFRLWKRLEEEKLQQKHDQVTVDLAVVNKDREPQDYRLNRTDLYHISILKTAGVTPSAGFSPVATPVDVMWSDADLLPSTAIIPTNLSVAREVESESEDIEDTNDSGVTLVIDDLPLIQQLDAIDATSDETIGEIDLDEEPQNFQITPVEISPKMEEIPSIALAEHESMLEALGHEIVRLQAELERSHQNAKIAMGAAQAAAEQLSEAQLLNTKLSAEAVSVHAELAMAQEAAAQMLATQAIATEAALTTPTPIEPVAVEIVDQEVLQSLEAFREEQIAEIDRRQKLSLKQIRFHKEHLERLRREFELERNEFLHLSQQIRAQTVQDEEILFLREKQLEHIRELLELREASTLREELVVREMHSQMRQVQAEMQLSHEELSHKQNAFELLVQQQQTELKSQHDKINNFWQDLASKEQKTLRMRQDIDRMHRETIALRQALDVSWKSIKNDAEFPALKAAFDLNRQQHQDLLSTELLRVDEESQKFLYMVQANHHQLQLHMEEVQQKQQQLHSLFSEYARHRTRETEHTPQYGMEERQQWLEDRLEAERIIRQLILQMENKAGQEPLAA